MISPQVRAQVDLLLQTIKFILSFKQGNPDWKIFPIAILKELPAVKWKLQNIQKLIENNPVKHASLLTSLITIFDDN